MRKKKEAYRDDLVLLSQDKTVANSGIDNYVASSQKLIKSKKRVKQYGEVFTPEFIVKQMCDLCEPIISDPVKKVFEPACGNGNFLVEVLSRKLSKIKISNNHNFELEILAALANVYAVDIQSDNVSEARKRLRGVVLEFVKNKKTSIYFLKAVDAILQVNIVTGNTLEKSQKSGDGRNKDLEFIDFFPDFTNGCIIMSVHKYKDIEKAYEHTAVSNIVNLVDDLSLLRYPPPKKNRKLANQPSSRPQQTLFN